VFNTNTRVHIGAVIFTARCVCIARSMLSQDVCLSVCLICPSDLSHAGIVLKRHHQTFFTNPHHSSFSMPNGMTIFLRGPPKWGVEYTCGMKKSRFLTDISLYLGNETRQGHNCNEMRIRNRTQAFKWYHFQ